MELSLLDPLLCLVLDLPFTYEAKGRRRSQHIAHNDGHARRTPLMQVFQDVRSRDDTGLRALHHSHRLSVHANEILADVDSSVSRANDDDALARERR